MKIVQALIDANVAVSLAEARRVVPDVKVNNKEGITEVFKGDVIQVGGKTYVV